MALVVKFDKETRKALKVRNGECQFCAKKNSPVSTVFADMHFCAACMSDIILDGGIGRAERDDLEGVVILRASEQELREAL